MSSVPEWKKKIPNWLTAFRIAIVPVIVWLMAIEWRWSGVASAALFALASMTDYLDGKLARLYQVESNFGKFLDPIADKLLVTSVLVYLIPTGRLDAIMVVIILARDTLIGGLRSVAAADRVVIAAGTVGKWKTAIQMFAIPCLLIHEPLYGIPLGRVGYWILWASVALSVWSGAEYIWGYVRRRAQR